jgi:hypothetical protein
VNQALVVGTKLADGSLQTRVVSDVRFVPLIGQFGFAGDPDT